VLHEPPLYYQLKIRFLVSQRKCQAGLQAAVRLGITRLSLEVDASLVKDAIKTDDYRLASIGGIVTEIKHIISAELSTCLVSVCKCDCNKVAHSLAALGCNLPSGCYRGSSHAGGLGDQ